MKSLVLADLMANTLRLIQLRFQCQGIRLTVETSCEVSAVWGMAHQLEQVFLNILVNACQAMPDGGEMRIRTDVAGPECVRVTFRDTGIGMSNQDVERAFQPFVSLWNEPRSGIGLALCRHIMARHHGDIALDSKPGEGATITLTLMRADGGKDSTRIPEYD